MLGRASRARRPRHSPRQPRGRCSGRPGFRPDARAAPRRRSGSSRRLVPCSRPFTSETTGTHGRSSPCASSSSTPRNPCEGTPITMTSALCAASEKSVVARSASGSADLLAEIPRVAVVVVDVLGGVLRPHPLQRRRASRADGRRRWCPRTLRPGRRRWVRVVQVPSGQRIAATGPVTASC